MAVAWSNCGWVVVIDVGMLVVSVFVGSRTVVFVLYCGVGAGNVAHGVSGCNIALALLI